MLIKSASHAAAARVFLHIDAVDLATIYDDVSIVAAAAVLDYHYTAITAVDSQCLPITVITLYFISEL